MCDRLVWPLMLVLLLRRGLRLQVLVLVLVILAVWVVAVVAMHALVMCMLLMLLIQVVSLLMVVWVRSLVTRLLLVTVLEGLVLLWVGLPKGPSAAGLIHLLILRPIWCQFMFQMQAVVHRARAQPALAIVHLLMRGAMPCPSGALRPQWVMWLVWLPCMLLLV